LAARERDWRLAPGERNGFQAPLRGTFVLFSFHPLFSFPSARSCSRPTFWPPLLIIPFNHRRPEAHSFGALAVSFTSITSGFACSLFSADFPPPPFTLQECAPSFPRFRRTGSYSRSLPYVFASRKRFPSDGTPLLSSRFFPSLPFSIFRPLRCFWQAPLLALFFPPSHSCVPRSLFSITKRGVFPALVSYAFSHCLARRFLP